MGEKFCSKCKFASCDVKRGPCNACFRVLGKPNFIESVEFRKARLIQESSIYGTMKDVELKDEVSLYPNIMPRMYITTTSPRYNYSEMFRKRFMDIESGFRSKMRYVDECLEPSEFMKQLTIAFIKQKGREDMGHIQNLIKDVIYNDPATIVLWKDGSKTVVKAEGEKFDPEKGLAMAISKRVMGDDYNYYETFKKYVGKYEKKKTKNEK